MHIKKPFTKSINIQDVCKLVGVTKATIYRIMKLDDTFPKSFKINNITNNEHSKCVVRWNEADIIAWLESIRD